MNKSTKNTVKVIVSDIRLSCTSEPAKAIHMAKKAISNAGCFGQIQKIGIHKKSIDARRKDQICFVYSVLAEVESLKNVDASALLKFNIKLADSEELRLTAGQETMQGRAVVVGLGPAGIFCALLLARYGYRPIVLERGDSVETRVKRVSEFLSGGAFDPITNVQFGAGGAGTFSDGKLTTRINDPRCSFVTKTLVELGANEDIAFKAKPHIGTDVLRDVVAKVHDEIIRLGGEIRYLTKVSEITDSYVMANNEKIQFGALVLATGHSARDVYDHLIGKGFAVEPKPFSVGVRIEHLQSDIDRAMYGDLAGKYGLSAADYAVSMRRGTKGVYSFCMCPGGTVVAAASEDGGVVVNGMSNRDRDGVNANAAIAVSVDPTDYDGTPAGAISFQRSLEQAAYSAGGRTFAAPCQTFGDFKNGVLKNEPNRIMPTYRNGDVKMFDLNKLFPSFVSSMLKDGISDFGRKIKGFDADDVPLTGVETRTSAPVRILRNQETLTAPGHDTIYPCGEGAGYAGGIMSAAVDGIRVAQAIIVKYRPN